MKLSSLLIAGALMVGAIGGVFAWLSLTPSSASSQVASVDDVLESPRRNVNRSIEPAQTQVSAPQPQTVLGTPRVNPLDTPVTAVSPTQPATTAQTVASKPAPAVASTPPVQPNLQVSRAKYLLYNDGNRKAVLDALSSRTSTSNDDHAVHIQALYDCAALYEKQRMNVSTVAPDTLATPDRKEAYERWNKRCEGIPKEQLRWEYAQAELVKLERQGNLMALSSTLPHLVSVNRYDMISERIDQLISLRDPVVMGNLSNFIITQMEQPALRQQVNDAGMDLAMLRAAWQTVECDAAGGCGPQSTAAAQLCATRGLCGTGSVLDRSRAAYGTNPAFERYREQLENSYKTGNWSWLNLQLVKNPPPKG
jgi:hypothetical protein